MTKISGNFVYVLRHEQEFFDVDDGDIEVVTLIGCFTSERRAMEERDAAGLLPSFSKNGGHFYLSKYDLDALDPSWKGGFFTWR